MAEEDIDIDIDIDIDGDDSELEKPQTIAAAHDTATHQSGTSKRKETNGDLAKGQTERALSESTEPTILNTGGDHSPDGLE